MHRIWILGMGLGLGAGCFSPTEAPDLDTDGNGTTDAEPTDPGNTMDAPTTTASTSDTDPAATSATGLTSGPSTTLETTTTETETETGIGGSCTAPGDCASGVCVESECVPCGDTPQPDSACAESDSATPFCSEDGSTCVACTADSCDGSTPACDPQVGCVACNEHSQCPDSACHLGGPDEGSCFDTADVVEVSDTSELDAALEGAGSGGQLVLWLSPGTFDYTGFPLFYYQEGVHPPEIAMIGDDTTLTGGATTLMFAPPLLYVSDVEFSQGPGRAISCSGSGEVWLDDSSLENYGTAILGCDTHLRRSQVLGDPTGTDFGGTLSVPSLVATNSDLGPFGDPLLNVTESIDLRYVTLVGNMGGLTCEAGANGSVRNSILVNPGTSVQGCNGVGFANNAHDQPGEGLGGTVVPEYDPDWFVISSGSRFFLSKSGQEVFEGIADWDEGDPLVDIEGDPRPQEAPSYPGVDEP